MIFKRQHIVPITLELSFNNPDGAFRNPHIPPQTLDFQWQHKVSRCDISQRQNTSFFKINYNFVILSHLSEIFTGPAEQSHMYSQLKMNGHRRHTQNPNWNSAAEESLLWEDCCDVTVTWYCHTNTVTTVCLQLVALCAVCSIYTEW